MKQKRSEIFESFAKIALEKGLIEVNAESRTEEEKLKDSNYKANIKALYNVDIDSGDLFEKAHPKSVIVSPSYDKVNGLFENERERHNIMVGNALKTPSGNLLGQKYADAHDDLLGELVRLGFSMDNKKIDDLRILADSCSERIANKNMIKNSAPNSPARYLSYLSKAAPTAAAVGTGFGPIGWAVGGIVAALALIAIVNHTSPSDQGVYNDCAKTIIELKELIPKIPQESSYLNQLLTNLEDLQQLSHDYNSLGSIDASTPEKLVDAANKNQDKLLVAQKYKNACAIMKGKIPDYIKSITSFQMNEPDKSYDWWQKIKNLTHYLTADDKEDVTLALETLQASLEASVTEANTFMQKAKEQEPSLMAMVDKAGLSDQSGNPATSQPPTAQTSTAPTFKPKSIDNQGQTDEHDDETAAYLNRLYEGHPVEVG
jgi:hypothetical protein